MEGRLELIRRRYLASDFHSDSWFYTSSSIIDRAKKEEWDVGRVIAALDHVCAALQALDDARFLGEHARRSK